MNDCDLVETLLESALSPVVDQPRHTPTLGLGGSALADRFCFWRGRSGRRYMFSVYRTVDSSDMAALPFYEDAVVIAAEWNGDGTRRMRRVGQTGSLPELTLGGPSGLACRGSGRELHYHLLTGNAAERQAMVDDLGGLDD